MHDDIVDLYERHARAWDRDRSRSPLHERAWLDRFLEHVPRNGTVLDLGCGTGQPIACYLIECGRNVVGVDSAPTLIEIARERFPEQTWIIGDMRSASLGRRFDGVLAWDSFFHLHADDQRAMFARFATHARRGAPLMFTSGTEAGVAIGEYEGDPLYHASLDTNEYDRLLAANGFRVLAFVAEDADCGGRTIWLAAYEGEPPESSLHDD